MYANVRGLKGKKHSMIDILNDNNPQIFLLTETQLRSNSGITFPGYIFYSRCRKNKPGGGVGILVRDDIKCNVAPHISDRDTELIWISVRRKNLPPIMIGSYYGKQESRTSKEEIEREMFLLNEEINEMKNEGEVLLAMDANAKVGILGEPISRNGALLIKVLELTGLTLMNKNTKCQGSITRTNTKNPNEISAIDFVTTSENVATWIKDMTIDECGLTKVKGKNDSDHNTIIVNMVIKSLDRTYAVKLTTWNIRASDEKWENFSTALENRRSKANKIIKSDNGTIDERYKKWLKTIEEAAWQTIGKTTIKNGTHAKTSDEVKEMGVLKKQLKQKIENEVDKEKKYDLVNEYKSLQEDTRKLIIKERSLHIEDKFRSIVSDQSRVNFWKEKRNMTKNPTLESLVVKDVNDQRVFEPHHIKEATANYYENLYRNKNPLTRPFHTELKTRINVYSCDMSNDDLSINNPPCNAEIATVIAKKKNGKSTTDLKNEMLKRPGDSMLQIISPMIRTIWKEENIPEPWRKGLITSLWKGRGDKEALQNHRGITVSSTMGNIMEELIDNRILQTVSFTQAQGGGIRGSSTYDHVFIVRAIIAISLKQKKKTYLTFYDVTKAFDNVDNEDMLAIMWDKGLKGKAWRLLKNLSSGLKASVKTRYGNTREVDMEIGGRQGSKLTGRMFSKLMDLLAEEVIASEKGLKLTMELLIGILLWMDDVVSCVEGETDQLEMLEKLDSFAKDHKLQWGSNKCKVMPIGNHSDRTEWNLGDLTIRNCTDYKYLGDIITSNGKNKSNVDDRKCKITASTLSITSIAASEVLNRIEAAVMLELHEKVNIPSLLNNAETWDLLKCEEKDLQQIELQSIKLLFDLPIKTLTPAIIHSFGIPYTKTRIDKKQLLYLHRMLNRDPTHWTVQLLMTLKDLDIGWHKSIKKTLEIYGLPNVFEEIKNIPFATWKQQVTTALETDHRNRLRDECHKKLNDKNIPKTKTLSIIPELDDSNYQRKPKDEILSCTKNECKALIIARYGMLECGTNFKGTHAIQCLTCNTIDNEEHRLNNCVRLKEFNFCDSDNKTSFDTIYSTDILQLREIISRISLVWNIKTGHGSMNA